MNRSYSGRAVHHAVQSLLALILVAVGCTSSHSSPPAAASRGAGLTEEQASGLVHEMINELLNTAPLPGISIAVSRDGGLLLAEGAGYADIDSRTPVTPATRFRTASVAKVITVTALGRLWQDGRVQLDAPVQQYVPAFPVKAWPITARELAGHLSGISHYSSADSIERRFYPSVTDALRVFAHEDLLFEPGTRYSYSTHGFTLLSAVIEGAAGTPFLDYLQREVFVPLGMVSTGPDMRAGSQDQVATLYEMRDGSLARVQSPEVPSYKWGAGGLISTPTDLTRLANGYLSGTYLDSSTVSLLWTSQHLISGKETGVGFAWRNGRDFEGRRTLEHAGSMEGARSVVSIYPDDSLVIALMTNRGWSSTIEETAHMLALPYLTTASQQPQPEGTFDGSVEVVAVSGDKKVRPGKLILSGEKSELIVDAGGSDEQHFRLFYLAADVYAIVRPDGIYHTTLSVNDGAVTVQVVAYGSPQLTSPAENPPFMTFVGAADSD